MDVIKVAIVVSTRNRGSRIEKTMESLRLLSNSDLEIVIVDQSDDQDTRRVVSRYLLDKRFRYIASTTTGVSRGRNEGISATTAPFICITDDDCIVPRDWPDRMVAGFSDPTVAVVWCSVAPMEQDGVTPQKLFHADETVADVADAWQRARNSFNLGAGMAVRRSAFAELGGFDECLGPGAEFPSAEDNDFAWRSLLNGWAVRQLSTVVVIHDGARRGSEVRALVQRDLRGVGGACGKYIRTRQWGVFHVLVFWTGRSLLTEPLGELVRRRRPRGLRRALWLWQGVWQSRRLGIDPDTLRYRAP